MGNGGWWGRCGSGFFREGGGEREGVMRKGGDDVGSGRV